MIIKCPLNTIETALCFYGNHHLSHRIINHYPHKSIGASTPKVHDNVTGVHRMILANFEVKSPNPNPTKEQNTPESTILSSSMNSTQNADRKSLLLVLQPR